MHIEIRVTVIDPPGNKTGLLESLEVVQNGDILFRAEFATEQLEFRVVLWMFSLNISHPSVYILIPFLSRMPGAFQIEVEEAIRLLNWLMGFSEWGVHWFLKEAATALKKKWDEDEPIEKVDFDKSDIEGQEMLRLWTKGLPTPAGESGNG